jgi:predicted dienelactone hydrolase
MQLSCPTSRLRALATALALVASSSASAATVCDATWHDVARDRDVPVRIRMPDGMATVPVVLFSHGLGGSRDAGTAWAEAWSQAGLAVIHLQHPGSDSSLRQRRDQDEGAVARLRSGMTVAQLVERARDVSFVLDEIARRRTEGACDLARLDRARVGMSGHSFGAHTTLAVAGQAFLTPAGERSLRDPRVTAAIALSPAPPRSANATTLRRAFGKIAIPVMSITGSEDVVPMLKDTTPEERQLPYRSMPAGSKYLLVFKGADHSVFSGHNVRRASRASDAHVIEVTAAATLAFWRGALLNDAGARTWLASTAGLRAKLAAGDTLQMKE